jgi:hypothetical protein
MLVTTVLAALPALMNLVGKGQGIGTLLAEIVGSFDGRPEDQERLRAEITKLASDNDEGHARLQAKLAAAALK